MILSNLNSKLEGFREELINYFRRIEWFLVDKIENKIERGMKERRKTYKGLFANFPKYGATHLRPIHICIISP